MSKTISFNCMHCQEEINADLELGGKEACCPGCSKSIVVPKPQQQIGLGPAALKEKFPQLINHDDKTLTDCSAFLKEYVSSYCDGIPQDTQKMHLVSSAFSKGIGPALAKRYANAMFTVSMEGSSKNAQNKLKENLFSNKKLNKQVNEILIGTGLKMKKKSFLGIFG